MTNANLSPLMRQYLEIKSKYPDTILMFQVGDFYELFYEDAQTASAFLGIALTQRGTHNDIPIPLCGVPVHVVNTYLTKLVRGGFKVAICDQLEEPRPGKIVGRGVTSVLTPGTLTDASLLNDKSASYLCVLFPTTDLITLFFVEILTGQIFITTLNINIYGLLESELSRFSPDEIVVPNIKLGLSYVMPLQKMGYVVTTEHFSGISDVQEMAVAWFNNQFNQSSANANDTIHSAITLLYTYLKRNNAFALEQLKQLSFYAPQDFLMLDANTQKNLELVKNLQDGSSANTLFSVLDAAVTPMGSRTIKKWILRPLIKKEGIEQRLDGVSSLVNNLILHENIRALLKTMGDLERIVGRTALRRAHLHDYVGLFKALQILPELVQVLVSSQPQSVIANIGSKMPDFQLLSQILESSINVDNSKDWLIKPGFNPELDRFRTLLESGVQSIFELERKEQEATGISSLKIRYNGAHGYGIEVTKPNVHLVPSHYMRTQTLVNRERYTISELKDLEYDLHRARTEGCDLEKELFEAIKAQVEVFIPQLKKATQLIAYLDALSSLAQVAITYNYTRPIFSDKKELAIHQGRHPVIESRLRDKFIANDTNLSDCQSLWIITGPNMGGKSTYLRQVALISIMAQMGSFVPAAMARVSILDRIFTRIGASDNVAEGKSTFLVEMEETSLICSQATTNSLVILDEVGRGTSTFDGLAIAQSVVEYIYEKINALCLFATHYHELTHLSEKFPGIIPYYAASHKTPQGIVLLHKIIKGVADGSFGLEVAQLAKLPDSLIERARDILAILNGQNIQNFPYSAATLCKGESAIINQAHSNTDDQSIMSQSRSSINQLHENYDEQIIKKYNAVVQRTQELEYYIEQKEKSNIRQNQLAQEIFGLDVDQITPKQALDILCRLKDMSI